MASELTSLVNGWMGDAQDTSRGMSSRNFPVQTSPPRLFPHRKSSIDATRAVELMPKQPAPGRYRRSANPWRRRELFLLITWLKALQ